MKAFPKILLAVFCAVGALLVTGFYIAAERHQASVFITKMNVFYIGVDNPIDVSMCSVAPEDIDVSLTGGTVTKGNKPGSYIVRVTGGTQSTLNVLQRGTTNLSSFSYRIKRVPDPVAYFGNVKANGVMSKPELQGQAGIFARMENFDFDLKFTVNSFEMAVVAEGKWKMYKANGPAITPDMKTALSAVAVGDKVVFQSVIVKGPDGTIRKIPGVVIDVK